MGLGGMALSLDRTTAKLLENWVGRFVTLSARKTALELANGRAISTKDALVIAEKYEEWLLR